MPAEEFQADPPRRPRPLNQPLPRRAGAPEDVDIQHSDNPASTIIPYKNPKALTAYYCGVFALIPCLGVVLGPIALVLGIMGIQYVNKNPTAKGIILGTLTTLGNWGVLLFTLIGIATAGQHR